MTNSIGALISGASLGYHITLPQSQGGGVMSGNWSNNNDVLPFYPDAQPGLVGGKCLNQFEYMHMVDEAKLAMATEKWEKIVTSRCFEVNPKQIACEQYAQALRKRFPETYLVVFNHPIWGRWIAASPELLLKRKGSNIETMALAGTLSSQNRQEWSEKEVAEHKVVRDMIVTTLKQNGVEDVQYSSMNELSYKTVRHLQTLISGQYDGDNFNLVRQLSPTPALAGMPVNQTRNWLRRNEGYHRGLYGGVIQVENEEEAYAIVLLRCVHWSNTKALGFVGGGIMPASHAELEWNETVMKQNAFIFDPNENIQ